MHPHISRPTVLSEGLIYWGTMARYNSGMDIQAAPRSPSPFNTPWRPHFRLVHLIYLLSLLGISLGTFGPAGVLIGVPLALFWTYVYGSPSRPRAFFIGLLGWLLLCPCLLPPGGSSLDAARRMSCGNNLKQIALALDAYCQKYRTLPPAFVADEQGKPQHSWRVLILPFLGYQTLYDEYRFEEPWDGPGNRHLLEKRPAEYACAAHTHSDTRFGRTAHPDTCTSYVAVIGSHTPWPGSAGRKLSALKDPLAETILVTETAGEEILWTERRDLTLPEAIDLLSSTDPGQVSGHWYEGFFSIAYAGRNAALGDGSVRYMAGGSSRELWSLLLQDRDGSKIDPADLEGRIHPPRKILYANYVRLGIWIIVALLPLLWGWNGPSSLRQTTSNSVRATAPVLPEPDVQDSAAVDVEPR